MAKLERIISTFVRRERLSLLEQRGSGPERRSSEGEATVSDLDREASRRYSVQFGPVWTQETKLFEVHVKVRRQ